MAFFLVVLATYWAMPSHRARLGTLLAASWVFYLAWYPIYLLLFMGLTALNYVAARAVDSRVESQPRTARALVIATIVLDLGNLAFFKYFDFFSESGAALVGVVVGSEITPPHADFFLPLGISFYTFQMIAYVVDVYRRHCPVIRSALKMMLFIAFFPQLIAGPIVRANEFIGQLSAQRKFETRRMIHGLDLIAMGLFKKVVVADQLASFVDLVYADPEGLGAGTLLLAVYAYAIQIYCDFSGYTDIGRGSAYCLGYELPRNFQAPYLSVNLADFWRRWHMTLSRWLRDYLYIPLGGNRGSRISTYRNLILTMVLGGLWHGAAWTFVVWGLLHGVGLAVSRLLHERRGVPAEAPMYSGRIYRWVSIFVTFHFVCVAWIFFRAQDFGTAWTVLTGLVSTNILSSADIAFVGMVKLGLVAGSVGALFLLHLAAQRATEAGVHRTRAWALVRPLVWAGTIVVVSLTASSGPQQFIYFQF
jgi:alginate O-acetyltransferase complex protein AlgI